MNLITAVKNFFLFLLQVVSFFCNSNAMLVNAMFITDLVQFWHTPLLRYSVLFINTRKSYFFTVLLSVWCWTSTWRHWYLFYSMSMILCTIPVKTSVIQQLSDSQAGNSLLEGQSEGGQ